MTEKIEKNEINDEISLKDLIHVLLDNKLLIITVTVIALAISAFYSYILATPLYESKVVINASEIGYKNIESNNVKSIIDSSGTFPVSTVDTYKAQLVSPQILHNVISSLDLKDSNGNIMSVSNLRERITVLTVDNTNLIEIKVIYEEATTAQDVANELAKSFITYIDDTGKALNQKTADTIKQQMELEEINLAERSRALADFMFESVSIEALRSEIDSLITQITTIKSELNSLEVEIETDQERLSILASEVTRVDLNIDSISLDAYGNVNGEEIFLENVNASTLGSSLMMIEYVNVQNNYLNNTSRYKAQLNKLEELEKILTGKQSKLTEEEYVYEQLNRDIEIAKQTYEAYQYRYQEAVVATLSEIGTNNIVISSEAIKPEIPVSPRKTMNLIVGLFLGMMTGCFAAFLRAYWRQEL